MKIALSSIRRFSAYLTIQKDFKSKVQCGNCILNLFGEPHNEIDRVNFHFNHYNGHGHLSSEPLNEKNKLFFNSYAIKMGHPKKCPARILQKLEENGAITISYNGYIKIAASVAVLDSNVYKVT
jgi:hypothetical protein